MSASELRPYQRSVFERIWSAFDADQRRMLLVAPTGSGKTVIAAEIIAEACRRSLRVLVLVHRRELTKQTSRKLHGVGVDHGIIQAGFLPRPGERVQIASVQTLHARAVRTSTNDMPDADLVIVDEAHHVRARSYRRILEAYPNTIVLGLTATPCRGDGRGLGNVFEALVECPGVAELTQAGFLVPATMYAPSQPDLTGVPVARGDYVERLLAERVDTPKLVGDIVTHIMRHARGRPTVVFATSVAHSVHIRDELQRAGIVAEHIDGSTPIHERDGILARLAAGTTEVVTNCGVLTEGWDCPEVWCVVLARPTRSLGLYRQMIGRVLRRAPGKVDALILDHAGAVFQHGLHDDPITWTLHEDRRPENPIHIARLHRRAPALTECPECHAVRLEGKPCPVTACGWRPRPKPAAVEVADGDLGRVERDGSTSIPQIDQQRFYRQLLGIARQRGYKLQFAYFKFREKFGCKPPWSWRSLSPEAPEPDVLAWVRSRQIAYAKAKGRAA